MNFHLPLLINISCELISGYSDDQEISFCCALNCFLQHIFYNTDNTNKGANKSGRMDVIKERPGSTLYILKSKQHDKKYETRNKT